MQPTAAGFSGIVHVVPEQGPGRCMATIRKTLLQKNGIMWGKFPGGGGV